MAEREAPELKGYENDPSVVMAPQDRGSSPIRRMFHGSDVHIKPGEVIVPGGEYSPRHAWATESFDLAAGYSADHAMMTAEKHEEEGTPHKRPMKLPVHEVEPHDPSEKLVTSKDFDSLVLGSKAGWKVKKVHWVPSEFSGHPDAPKSAL